MLESIRTAMAVGTIFMAAFSSSPSYQLQNYGVGSGGVNNSSSPTYRLNASSGEVSGVQASNATTRIGSGTTATRQANVPSAPTLSNGTNTFYNKLGIIINKSVSDATDYTYSVAVSTNNFTTTNYVQADGTLSTTPVYRTYTSWGGASGTTITGLSPGTTYQAKVDAMQAGFSASGYGPVASSSTSSLSLSFSITPNSVSLGSLTPGTVRSGSSDLTFSFTTNGASGGAVYTAGNNAGLRSSAANYTIASATADLTSASNGFGLRGLTATQTSGGPFIMSAPFNGANNNVGGVTTTFQTVFSSTVPVTGGSSTASVRGKSDISAQAATDYTETLTFIASASF